MISDEQEDRIYAISWSSLYGLCCCLIVSAQNGCAVRMVARTSAGSLRAATIMPSSSGPTSHQGDMTHETTEWPSWEPLATAILTWMRASPGRVGLVSFAGTVQPKKRDPVARQRMRPEAIPHREPLRQRQRLDIGNSNRTEDVRDEPSANKGARDAVRGDVDPPPWKRLLPTGLLTGPGSRVVSTSMPV